jgi:hypothetical protein
MLFKVVDSMILFCRFEFEHHAFTTQRTSAQLDSLALSPVLWKKSTKTVHISGRCGCHHPVTHDYSFEIIEFDQPRANALQQQMVAHADAKMNGAAFNLFFFHAPFYLVLCVLIDSVYSFKQYQLVLAKTEIDLPLFQFLQRLDDIIRSEVRFLLSRSFLFACVSYNSLFSFRALLANQTLVH